MFHFILQIYFTINARVTLFTDVFKAISLSEKHKLPSKLPWHQIHTLKKYTASKNDILNLSDLPPPPPPRHLFPGVPLRAQSPFSQDPSLDSMQLLHYFELSKTGHILIVRLPILLSKFQFSSCQLFAAHLPFSFQKTFQTLVAEAPYRSPAGLSIGKTKQILLSQPSPALKLFEFRKTRKILIVQLPSCLQTRSSLRKLLKLSYPAFKLLRTSKKLVKF